MEWQKVPEENKIVLEEALQALPLAEKKMMFGSPVWFFQNNMFAGAHQEEIFLRLGAEDRVACLGEEGVVPFTPMGRMMKEYVSIPRSLLSSAAFAGWLDKSWAYVASLPPKEKKKPKKIR